MKVYAFLFVTCFWFTNLYSQKEEKPNVLFIIADDLNCNIGAYGHYLVKTPNIDALANEGFLFQNAFCNFPLCGPSRASMMTGLYPNQTGHWNLRDLVRDHVPDVITLSQNFMSNGYTAARVGKIYHYNNPKGIGTPGHDDPQSWDHRVYPSGRDKEEEDLIFSLHPGHFGATLSWMAAEGTDEEQTDGMVATEAIKLLEKYAENETPFFLGVGFYKPHTPYVAPKKYFEMYPKDKIKVPKIPENYLSTLPEPAQKLLTRFKEQNNLSDSLSRCAIQAYYATISFLDAQVGRVMDALEATGLKDNTIVIFTSDHGYHMGEQGYYQKLTLFEHSGRIPLIVSYPGMKNCGKQSESIVEMIDFYPTLSELAVLEYPEYVAGKSFLPVLNNPNTRIRNSALTQVRGNYTIRTENFRYSRWGDGGPGMTELYDRQTDPAEMINLADNPEYQSVIQKLNVSLNERINSASAPPKGLKVIK